MKMMIKTWIDFQPVRIVIDSDLNLDELIDRLIDLSGGIVVSTEDGTTEIFSAALVKKDGAHDVKEAMILCDRELLVKILEMLRGEDV